MKRYLALLSLLSILIIQLIIPLWCGAGTYYVNTVTGANGNNGTSASTPKQSLNHVNSLTAAGDTAYIVAPATNPVREGLSPVTAGTSGNVVTYQGTSALQKAYITTLKDVSHGATIGNLIVNGDMEGWKDVNTIWYLSKDAAITREDTITNGSHSAKYVRSGSDIRLYPPANAFYLPASTAVTLSWKHYETAADIRFRFSLKDTTDNKYLQQNLTWDTTGVNYDPGAPSSSLNAWGTTTVSFTTNTNTGVYTLSMWLTANGTSYLDDLSLTIDAGTYAWAAVAEHNYHKLNIKVPQFITIMGKSTSAAWTASGVEALAFVPKAADLATCDSTAGTWFWDNTNYDLYYNPAAGEDPTALHIEVGIPRLDTTPKNNAASAAIDVNKEYITLNYLKSAFSGIYGVHLRQPNTITNYCDAIHGAQVNFYATANTTVNNAYSAYPHTEDCYNAYGAGVILTVNRSLAEYAYDDGFQAGNGGKIVCNYCIASGGGFEGVDDNTGFVAEGENSAMELYNCTAYGNYGPGIRDNGTGASIVKNSIAWGNATGGGAGVPNAQGDGAGLTADHNLYQDQDGWTTDASDITADPLFRSTTDFRLKAGSPACWMGADIWTGVPNVFDMAGRRITDATGVLVGTAKRGISAGAYQCTMTTGGMLMGLGVGF